MIGKVIEGRYTGASVHKLPDKNILFIVTEKGNKVALSKSNVISIDDITEQYSSDYRKVLMVMWNDFETSILQLGITPQNKPVNNTVSNPMTMHSQENRSHSITPQTHSGRNNVISSEKHSSVPIGNANGRDRKSAKFSERDYSKDEKHRKPKKSVKQTRTDSSDIPSTSTGGVGTKIILLWLCIGLLLVGVFFKATVMNTPTEEDILVNRIEAFNLLHSTLTQESDLSDAEQEKMIAAYAKDAGLSYQAQDPFSKTFVDEYIATYSVHAFVEKLYTIYEDEFYRWDCTEIGNEVKCEYQMFNNMLIYALETNGIELMTVSLPSEGSAGFYADYPEMVPETTSTEKRGKFFNSSGENVHYETKTCTTTGSAHGDFATMREEGYSYDEGRYEWKNGVFYDELPSWKPYDNTFYYYKGVRLGKINLSTTQYFVLDNAAYFLLSPESCARGEHGRRTWLKVEVDEEALAEQMRRINIFKDAAKEEMRTFIPEVLKENGMNALYEAACKPEVWDSLTVTYPQEKTTDEQFSIDAVYSVKIGGEYVVLTAQLTGSLSDNSFDILVVGIDVSNDADLYLDSATPELTYATAEALLAEGKTIEAAMAFGQASSYSDAAERSFELWNNMLKPDYIGAGSSHVVALTEDGSVTGIGNINFKDNDIFAWKNIRTLSVGNFHTVGLTDDGKVVAVGNGIMSNSDLFNWENIVAISSGYGYTMGLKNDGTVVTASHDYYAQYDTTKWTNIMAISAGYEHAVGLRVNGTVVAVGDNEFGECDVSQWTDIVAVSAGQHFTIGLKSDGTVVATGDHGFGQCDVSQWSNIIAISAGAYHTVGLKADGTVVATEWRKPSQYPNMRYNGQSNVNDWRNVVSISAGWDYTIGLKADGTVVAVGENDYGQCDVNTLPKIKTS